MKRAMTAGALKNVRQRIQNKKQFQNIILK
jgi:hypothetical protein